MLDSVQRPMPTRPKYLNLIQIRLPLPGVVSIMHRISGAVLFLALPLLLWWLQQSLLSGNSFFALKAIFSNGYVKLVLIGLFWGYMHHLCAGIRHLALDVDFGTELASARLASILVLAVSITITVIAGVLVW
jgi:succinate dehydrogenase / fumarate reductase cytochrome b subunit